MTYQPSSVLVVASLLLSPYLGGCATTSALKHDPQFIRAHVIAVDGRGRPHDPASAGGREYDMTEFRSQIASMLLGMHDFFETHPGRKLLLFVHGGLNGPADSLQAADAEMDHVIAAGYYPIYLNWNSDLISTYGEHLTSITEGRTDRSVGRDLLIPFYAIADLTRAAGRAPIVWANQAAGDYAAAAGDVAALPKRQQLATMPSAMGAPSQRWAQGPHGQALAQFYQQMRVAEADEKQRHAFEQRREQLHIYIGPDKDIDAAHLAGLEAAYILTAPTKFASQPLIDCLGTPAWQNMSRRTLIAFDGDLGGSLDNSGGDPELVGQPDVRAQRAVDFSTTGALEVFREELRKVIGDRADNPMSATRATKPLYDVTLVGHSMGTMVLNEWLRRDIRESRRQFYTSIVYMGAACTVRDFGRAVVPYLLEHPETQFYSLMLHPLAELRERRRAMDLVPRGSLLVWLDSFLTDPQAPLDRTLGRWDNIMSATEVIPRSVRGQVTLKAFALAPYNDPTPPPGEPNYGPQEHGQFRGQPYWCKEFWASENAVAPGYNCGAPPN